MEVLVEHEYELNQHYHLRDEMMTNTLKKFVEEKTSDFLNLKHNRKINQLKERRN